MQVSSILDHLMKIYDKRKRDSRNVMVSSVLQVNRLHEHNRMMKMLKNMLIHTELEITIQNPNRLDILISFMIHRIQVYEFVLNTKAHEVYRSYTLYFWLIVDMSKKRNNINECICIFINEYISEYINEYICEYQF